MDAAISAPISVSKMIDLGGGNVPFRRALGVTRQTVYNWRQLDRIPPERVMDVCAVTGLKPEQVRPDVFYKSDCRRP